MANEKDDTTPYEMLELSIDANAIVMKHALRATVQELSKLETPAFYGPDTALPDGFFQMANAIFHAVRKDIQMGDMNEEELDALVEEYLDEAKKAKEEAESKNRAPEKKDDSPKERETVERESK